MKKIFLAFIICAGLGFSSCSLDEYNPASLDESKMSTYDGLRATQAYCYSPLYGQMCDKYDFLFLTDGCADLWNNPNNSSWAEEVIYYEGLVPAASSKGWSKVFLQAYSSLGLCNTAIEKAQEVTDGNPDDVAVLLAETYFLRAYYHLLLTTQYGPITLVLSNPASSSPNITPQRNTLTEIYTSITDDLKAAYAGLKDTPFEGNRQRPTKAAALGLLARAYVQGAGQGLTEDGKSYWTLARETAEKTISAYPDRWYNDVKEVWSEKNNRNNKEALFVAAGPDPNNMSQENWEQSYKGANQLFRQSLLDIRNIASLLDNGQGHQLVWNNGHRNYIYGGQNNQSIAPSKYYLDCFNPDWDRRWEYTFMVAFGGTSIPAIWGGDAAVVDFKNASFQWTEELCALYGVDPKHIGKTIQPYFNMGNDVVKAMSAGGLTQYTNYVWPRNAKGESSEIIDPLTTTGKALAIDLEEVLDENENRIFLYLSKKPMTKEEKAKYPFAIVNIDDLFTSDATDAVYWTESELNNDARNVFVNMKYNGTNNANLGKVRPVFIKFNNTSNGMTGTSNAQNQTGDIFLLRMAEMYLIAAECYAQEGNGSKAAEFLNPLRERAVRASYTSSDWKLSTATMDDVYDEYARELGGEFSRWALLQRHNAFKERLKKYNKRAYDAYTDWMYWRPISLPFLESIDNADEYGDNGYGLYANSGLDGYLK